MDIYFNFRGTDIHPQSEARAKPVKWDKKKHALLSHDFTFSEMESYHFLHMQRQYTSYRNHCYWLSGR